MSQTAAPFHPGEREVQKRVGVQDAAGRVGSGIRPHLIPAITRFLATQRMVIVASIDVDGRPWASLLTGPPGFLEAAGEDLRIAAVPADEDPLAENLRQRPELGLLVLDPGTRQRVRLNGRGIQTPEGVWLQTEQVYGNCPKYIQKRRLLSDAGATQRAVARANELDTLHREAIAAADTFFIASFHPEGGADASHRGGRSGFVRVKDDKRLAFPDYPGNNMFNTLGNLVAYPRAGLLLLDFARGDVLQLTGRTALRFEPRREIQFDIDEILIRDAASPLRWELVEPSPANP